MEDLINRLVEMQKMNWQQVIYLNKNIKHLLIEASQCEDLQRFCVFDYKLNIFDKTSHLKTSLWAVGTCYGLQLAIIFIMD